MNGMFLVFLLLLISLLLIIIVILICDSCLVGLLMWLMV